MRWSAAISSLLAVAAVAEARSRQHVGRKDPARNSPEARAEQHDAFLAHYLATRQVSQAKFASDKTANYSVNGTGLPDVDFDIGESYAGYLPITNNTDDTDELFFWFFPNSGNSTDKEILIWLNGGPGCSSFEGLLQENGPFQWQYGTYKPVPNPWAWNRIVNTVWVEQPIGTGFSKGKVTAKDEEDVADQFVGFWKNFMELFSMQGYKVYVTGESYAGMYVPYIAAAMLDQNDTTYYDLSGIMINDPVIGNDDVQASVTTVPFVNYHADIMPFNNSFVSYMQDMHESCGFADYNDQYLVYPPSGAQPTDYAPSRECSNLWGVVTDEAMSINPCFDVYQVATTCPLLWDVLGFPGSITYSPTDSGPVYFDRTDVKAAIHAPTDMTWEECSSTNVFKGSDRSDPSSWAVIPQVADATQNVIIGHGSLDMILLPNGTLLSIQNMTWGGQLGFQSVPVEPFFVPFHLDSTPTAIYRESNDTTLATLAAAGVLGTAHTERGVTYVSVDLSGHMIPQYAPSAAMRKLEFLLGRVDDLSSTQPFEIDASTAQPAAADLGYGTGPATYAGSEANGTSTGTVHGVEKSGAMPTTTTGVARALALGVAAVAALLSW
ncbi:alpha/beta-hydrolase [Xylariaceae sp. FL0804]|nr:alpha/beta-hydrolase [Xylariaceae sp. FL0804]